MTKGFKVGDRVRDIELGQCNTKVIKTSASGVVTEETVRPGLSLKIRYNNNELKFLRKV
jgi:hypothetical protein